MSVFKSECPHCGTMNVAMTIRGDGYGSRVDGLGFTDVLAQCGHCQRCVLVSFNEYHKNIGLFIHGIIQSYGVDVIQSHVTISPSLKRQGAPPDTYPVAARYYAQGEANLPANPDAAVGMFRAALEAAMGQIISDNMSDSDNTPNLYDRIVKAHNDGKIDKNMKDWAHNIRIFGNQGVHVKKFVTSEQAEEVKEFTRILFLYLYTLPAAIRRQRKARKPPSHDAKLKPKN